MRTQAPLNLGRHDDPQPDVVVVVGSERDYIGSDNRVQPLLVIEVSDTTLAYDRGRKARRYGRAGIADYWIVNLQDRRLEVYRNPVLQGRQYRCQSIQSLGEQDEASPLARPAAKIRVSELLP